MDDAYGGVLHRSCFRWDIRLSEWMNEWMGKNARKSHFQVFIRKHGGMMNLWRKNTSHALDAEFDLYEEVKVLTKVTSM